MLLDQNLLILNIDVKYVFYVFYFFHKKRVFLRFLFFGSTYLTSMILNSFEILYYDVE